jgi:hypothetical protein
VKRIPHWLILALVLIVSGAGIAWWKVDAYGFPLQAEQTEDSWTVQARIRLRPGEGPVKAELKLPSQTPGLARLREDYISRGFGLDVQESRYERTATWAIRRVSGVQTLYYRAQFYQDSDQTDFAPRPPFPDVPLLEEPFATAMTAITDEARRQSADIASFTTSVIARVNSESPSEEVRLFLNASRFEGDRLRITRILLSGARIPTEKINGLMLVDSERQARTVRWLAVHNGQRWLFFDPATGRQEMPGNLLVWWRGDRSAVRLEGAELVDATWSVRRNPIGSLDLAQQRAEAHDFMLAGLDLGNLPLQTQSVYAALLLVPVGAFLLVFMRNVIGVRALGTFMPVLIALAFRETGLLGGLLLFSLVVAIGLMFRFYLERLRLLLVPRLSAVLTIVVLLMLGLSMLSQKLGWEVGLSVGLFPMVILAMVIERMSIIWEERGAHEAMIEGLGSTVIAILTFLLMGLEVVQYLVFVFPELLLVVLGLTIAMGRYSGYRVSELIRFRELAGKKA